MIDSNTTLKRTEKNKQTTFDKDNINNNIEPMVENKLKKWIAYIVIVIIMVFAGTFFLLRGGEKAEMFDATTLTKSQVQAKFKDKFNKELGEENFVYEDGGLRSKLNTVFKQTPEYGTKFDPSKQTSEFIFTINRPEEVKKINPTNKVPQKVQNTTFVVQKYTYRLFSEVKEELAQVNAPYTLEFKLTKSPRLEGYVSNQNYFEKTVLNTKEPQLILTIFTQDPQNAPNVYSNTNTKTNTQFAKNDPSNPNIKKDKSIIWSWKQGDKVDFRSFNGPVPLTCYTKVCYYDGTGKPTPLTLNEQLNR